MPAPHRRAEMFGRQPLRERRFVTDALRTETVGGVLLLVSAVAAVVLANSDAAGWYESVKHHEIGPSTLGLHIDVADWAKDGLLTVFFFVAGIELKRELVTGELRDRRTAALPVVAALCGMAVPALVYLAVNVLAGGSPAGWAIPTATDIAFALTVLAVIGSSLPSALRAFLLTLAVADDLFAILIIAVFFTSDINLAALGLSVAGLVLFRLLHRAGVHGWYIYVPLALVIWTLMHESGVHPTVAGVAMGLMLRVTVDPGERESPAERIEHLVRPVSAGLAVPAFAFFAAGVSVGGKSLAGVFGNPEPLGVFLGLFLGKMAGILGGSWLTARFTRANLSEELQWADVAAVSMLSGIGFTVSLLISELAFEDDPALAVQTKAAVLTGSLAAALVACVLLKWRDHIYRELSVEENLDEDMSGIPDIYEQDDPEYHRRMIALYEAKLAEHRKWLETYPGGHDTDDTRHDE